jgi:hypothetical protein
MNAKPATHARGCQCPLCDRRERAEREARAQRELNLERARDVQADVRADRKTQAREAWAKEREAAAVWTSQRARELQQARAAAGADWKLRRFLELRAAGVPRAQAEKQVDQEFGGSHGSTDDES